MKDKQIEKGCRKVKPDEEYVCDSNHLCKECKSELKGYQQARVETIKEVEKMIDELIKIHPKISDENMAVISNLQILKQQLKNLEKDE